MHNVDEVIKTAKERLNLPLSQRFSRQYLIKPIESNTTSGIANSILDLSHALSDELDS
jgi:hypothetical protein